MLSSRAPDIRAQLDRVLASPGFVRNERLSRFLRFLVERHLDGREGELKEAVVAVEVFGRKPDYDPKLDSIVRTEAGRLRARLLEYYADHSADPVLIEIPKGGYAPAFQFATPSVVPVPRPPINWTRLRTTAVLTAAVLVSAAALWWTFDRRASPESTIAVLPLENLTTDPGSDYFADGLTDELIRSLSIIDGLAVRSRTSSFVFKGQPRNVRDAGRQLNADYLVEGAVLRAGDRLRVNVTLVRARDDFPIWSARYDRELMDVFAIQEEIAIGIVNNLRLKLGSGRRRYEGSVEAYDHYLRGRALSLPAIVSGAPQSVSLLTPTQRFEQAAAEFERAIALDHQFAPAYSGLAATLAMASVRFPYPHPADELARMRQAAERAVQLDPLLAEAHVGLGLVFAREAQWAQAEHSFRQALELDRNRAATYRDYAYWVLAVLGRHDEAIALLRTALRNDPLSADVRNILALVLIAKGEYEEAGRLCELVRTRSECLARVRSGQGRFEEIIALLPDSPSVRQKNPQTIGFLGYAYARAGRRTEAEALLREATTANTRALILAGLGDKAGTLDALERMTALGAQRVGLYLHYPEMAFLRGDARVDDLRRRVGLPPDTLIAGQ